MIESRMIRIVVKPSGQLVLGMCNRLAVRCNVPTVVCTNAQMIDSSDNQIFHQAGKQVNGWLVGKPYKQWVVRTIIHH